MRYSEIEDLLSADEISAIGVLEFHGWEILTETKIEDTHRKDGGRIRTFALSGRYDVALVLKDAPKPPIPQVEIEEEEEEVEEEVEPEDEPKNFWIDEKNWKRLQKEPFADAIENHTNDLIDVKDEIRDEVHRKFDRLFDPDDWPF
jgi:hypothetical protein